MTAGSQSPVCPGVLKPEQITVSPQCSGPAWSIVAFTGGDLTCRPEFYASFDRRVKAQTNLSGLIETNGWGLTPTILDIFTESGVDAFWLDIKAYDEKVHKWLTGCTNKWILKLPEEILSRGLVLEVLSSYNPGSVETNQLRSTADLLAAVSDDIPLTILAFFPEHKMYDFRPPETNEMIGAYTAVIEARLNNVRLGNIGVFVKTQTERDEVVKIIGHK